MEFLNQEFYGNTIKNWAISMAIVIGAVILAKVIFWIIGKYIKSITEKTKSKLDDILVDKLEEPLMYGVGILGFYYGFHRLTFGDNVDNFFVHVFTVVFTLNITWLVVRTIDSIIEEYLIPVVTKSESDFDDHLIPVIRKLVKAMLWSLGVIIGLNNAGFDVAALIAGLGIGGLALALAAQDTVKNIFGGVMIYLDRPFKLTDRIKINGVDGTVEEVGVRSTRIRTLEGRLVTIPNAQFSDNAIENVTVEPTRKVVTNLGLTYDTTPENMQLAMDKLKAIAENHPGLSDDMLISFNSWGDFSMGILFIYYILPTHDIFVTQSEINMEILRQFNEAGLEFAFPTQTIYKK